MSRQRMVRPEFYDSESLSTCSVTARYLFIALWVHGNDYGNMRARLSWLKLKTFPYDEVSEEDMLSMLCELERVGCVRGYIVDEEPYINIPNFSTYQTVRKPNKSNVPDPPKDIPKRTKFFIEWKECGISDALVQYQYGTSDVMNPDNYVENHVEKQGSTTPVRHQYGTSDAQKKERKKEVVVLQQQLPKEKDASRGAVASKAAPPDACPLCDAPIEKTNAHKGELTLYRCTLCGEEVWL